MAATENTQFAIEVDFSKADLWDPTKGGINDPEPGAYLDAKVVGAVEYGKDDGKKSIKVTVALPGAGETDLYLGLDLSKEANVRKILTALASCGVDPAKIKAKGKVQIVPAMFMGKDGKGATCHVIVKLVEGTDAQNRKKLNDKEFATKDQALAYKAAMGSAAPTGGGSTSAAQNGAAAGGGDLAGLFG